MVVLRKQQIWMAKRHAYVDACQELVEIIAKRQKVQTMYPDLTNKLCIVFIHEICDQLIISWPIIFFIDAPCQCQDDRLDDNGGGNCEKPLAGASRNAGKDYCYVTLPSGCKDLEDSPVDGQEGQKISSEACNSGMDHTCNVNDSAKSILLSFEYSHIYYSILKYYVS